jgi:hypothetical protein
MRGKIIDGDWYKTDDNNLIGADCDDTLVDIADIRFLGDEQKEVADIIVAAPTMKKCLENNLRDMDKIDELCKIAGVHPYTQMREEMENALKITRGEA